MVGYPIVASTLVTFVILNILVSTTALSDRYLRSLSGLIIYVLWQRLSRFEETRCVIVIRLLGLICFCSCHFWEFVRHCHDYVGGLRISVLGTLIVVYEFILGRARKTI